jgi:hypothetical protein
MVKRISILAVTVAMLAAMVFAVPYSKVPPVPKVLANGTFVYVAAYDGDQFNPNLLPSDRNAISAVQDALQKWGHYIIVYHPREADVILLVQSRPTEDVLAAYDAKMPGAYLWRVSGENGLQAGETPLVTQFEKAVEQAKGKR